MNRGVREIQTKKGSIKCRRIHRRFNDVICQAGMLNPIWRGRLVALTVNAVFGVQLEIFEQIKAGETDPAEYEHYG
jgi:hypothetical protein